MTSTVTFRSSLSRRRTTLACALSLTALPLALLNTAQADTFPSKAIKLVVPFPAGGPTDTASRIIGTKLAERLKQPVVIDNRAGASGSIAAAAVAKSAPDGYTLMMLATPTLLAPHLYKKAGYDVLKDFAPIATVYDLPIVMVVNPAMMPTVTDLQKLITHAKAQPDKLNYTSSGTGSFGHLTMELLKSQGQFAMQHVPYRGGVPAMTDVLGGQVPMMYADMVAALPHIQSGRLRAIAVGSPKRVSFAPDIKTVSEQGFPGFDAVSWGGLLAPGGTPKEIVNQLSAEIKTILDDKEVQEKLVRAGTFAAYQDAAKMGSRMRQDFDKWGKVVREKSITAE